MYQIQVDLDQAEKLKNHKYVVVNQVGNSKVNFLIAILVNRILLRPNRTFHYIKYKI